MKKDEEVQEVTVLTKEQIDALHTTITTKSKVKLNPQEMKENIINMIMQSPLNISVIPDELERQIYEFILSNMISNVPFFYKIFPCCKK